MPDPEIMMIPIPSRRFFVVRMLRNACIAAGVVGGGLLIGMTGYHRLGGLGWVESFYYASMILSGEGPPPDPQALTATRLLDLHLFAGLRSLQRRDIHHDGWCALRAGDSPLPAQIPSGNRGSRRARPEYLSRMTLRGA